MKRFGLFLISLLIAQGAMADGVLVRYRDPAGVQALTLNPQSGLVKIEAKSDEVEALVNQLNRDPRVDYAEPDYPIRPAKMPDDPLIQGSYSSYNYQISQVVKAWDLVHDCSRLVVAVIDSGIDLRHPDLQDNIWFNGGEIPDNGKDDDDDGYIDDLNGFNFIDHTNQVQDDLGHGTAVSGIVGAVGDNDVGSSGVCWSVQILPLKIFGNRDENLGALSSAIEAIDYAIAQGARIINLSWVLVGGEKSVFLEEAIAKAHEAGILVVAAAGNDGKDLTTDPIYPAAYDLPNLLTVAAHGHEGEPLPFSNFGNGVVDVAAPGIDIITTGKLGMYVMLTGTSAAAPHVSGAAALLFSLNSDLTPDQIAGLLRENTFIQTEQAGLVLPTGNLNVFQALSAVGALKNTGSTEGSPSTEETSEVDPSAPAAFNPDSAPVWGCSLIQ